MSTKKKCVAMLLAGGQGSRLSPLTSHIAKPAVPFGARYRIIDFSISNCVNSGIDTVGVLTQYQPLELNDYLGNGQAWGLNINFGGLHVLPPYQAEKGADWFKGTANAIYQNLKFIRQYDPDYILVLSGDHIYKMDYAIMLEEHIRHQADCTLAVIDVPLEEASRFGIMTADQEGRVVEFQEKPAHPTSTLASMGVYIFSTGVLMEHLEADEKDPASDNDFGKNIIPAMLREGRRVYTHLFKGYWRDVGTLDSFWAANMDALGEKPTLVLNDPGWRIYYSHSYNPPQYVGPHARINTCIAGDGNEIDGCLDHSVLFNNIIIEEGARVKDSILMSGCVVRKGASIEYAIVDSGVQVQPGAVIGGSKDKGPLTVVPAGLTIEENRRISQGEVITGKLK